MAVDVSYAPSICKFTQKSTVFLASVAQTAYRGNTSILKASAYVIDKRLNKQGIISIPLFQTVR